MRVQKIESTNDPKTFEPFYVVVLSEEEIKTVCYALGTAYDEWTDLETGAQARGLYQILAGELKL